MAQFISRQLLVAAALLLDLPVPAASLSLRPHSDPEIEVDGNALKGRHMNTLNTALRLLNNKHNKKACLTIAEREEGFMGGFANAVGFVNTVYDYASRFKTSFVFPHVATKTHHDGSDFNTVFGNPPEETCEVMQYSALCDEHRKHDTARAWMRERHRCDLRQYVVDVENGTKTQAHACGCEALVAIDLDHMDWHFDYSMTHNWLRNKYWEAQSTAPQRTKPSPCDRSVVLHVRLGDVALHRDTGANWAEKYVEPSTYITMLRALANIVPPKCLNLIIVTDGEREEPQPQAVKDGAKDLGFTGIKIYDKDTIATEAFEALTHADVLMCGGSGFCRLAAVLAHEDAARICVETADHPVAFLPNVTELQVPGSTANYTMTEEEQLDALKKNRALQAFGAEA